MRTSRSEWRTLVGLWGVWALLCVLLVLSQPVSAAAADPPATFLDAIPDGYTLQAYDDCGVPDRQPHVLMEDAYFFTFATSDTDADVKSRSAVFSYKSLKIRYDQLDANRSYVLALTYASDHVYKRVQSLWANGVELHGPLPLPQALAIRKIVSVPHAVTQTGQMELEIRIHGEVNATVSVIELWADGPGAGTPIRLNSVSGMVGDLRGQVQDIAFEPVADVIVRLEREDDHAQLAESRTAADGWFRIPRDAFADLALNVPLQVTAVRGSQSVIQALPADQRTFTPVRYRPLPVAVESLATHEVRLDGEWCIDPQANDTVRTRPFSDPAWRKINVPGQWKQQGIDVPAEQSVAMGREFAVPREWAGHRVILRFDAIHAGTTYWLNGQQLGTSENLFTPVEWDVTEHVQCGEVNRLDLTMRVDTVSERLSFSSGYAFHNLGGIDRAVRLFVLPVVHVRQLSVVPLLDAQYTDGELRWSLAVENTTSQAMADVRVRVSLVDPSGAEVPGAGQVQELGKLQPGQTDLDLIRPVIAPQTWTAEHPHRYLARLELMQGDQMLERVERRIGFRRIEVQGERVLVNGRPVKLAGACHHEMDPLSGRADTMKHADEDIRLLKEANLNYVRTSHYPPTQELVEAADRYGMYLEVEAPFCWVAPQDDLAPLQEVLTPTSAMIDYYADHPSVLLWSLANESQFNRFFEISHELVRQLDPTRPTTFNNPDPRRVCEIANLHYPPMPYAEQAADDPRPLLLGEYFFPVCHEQTDVAINPGLREFFGAGHSDPKSAWGQHCAAAYLKPYMKPCAVPGTWSHMVHTPRLLGGAIWAGFDDAFFFPDGTHAGYAWHHGYWGIIDVWRRPKPEWWLTKLVFSPVWLTDRKVDCDLVRGVARVSVENRYDFTNLSELEFKWRIGVEQGVASANVAPGATGVIEIPLPNNVENVREADLQLEVFARNGMLVQSARLPLRERTAKPLPRLSAPAPKVVEMGNVVVVQGAAYTLVLDKQRGEFVADDSRHQAAVVRFPRPHLTQYDFGDLAGPHGKPYAIYPEESMRVVDSVTIEKSDESVLIRVVEHYRQLTGELSWRMDAAGMGEVRYRYVYHGEPIDTREAGVRFVCRPECDALTWRRWSEWGVFPDDSISRTEGTATALRSGVRSDDPEGVRPTWPWSLDQTKLGTADFRSVKFHIQQATLQAQGGPGLRVHAQADRHVRACLADDGVLLHVLTRCDLGQVELRDGDVLEGTCTVELVR
jgi:hypothetical protein